MSWGDIRIWWKPIVSSELEKYWSLRSLPNMSSVWGIGQLFGLVIRLRLRYSMTSLSFSWTCQKITGLHKGSRLGEYYLFFKWLVTYSVVIRSSSAESWEIRQCRGLCISSFLIKWLTAHLSCSPVGSSLRKTEEILSWAWQLWQYCIVGCRGEFWVIEERWYWLPGILQNYQDFSTSAFGEAKIGTIQPQPFGSWCAV